MHITSHGITTLGVLKTTIIFSQVEVSFVRALTKILALETAQAQTIIALDPGGKPAIQVSLFLTALDSLDPPFPSP